MSGVLRKKIELAAGLPPSLVKCERLWLKLASTLNIWADEAFGEQSFFALDARRVCRGALADKLLANSEVAYFDSAVSPGMRAVAVDEVTMTALAASRLGVAPDDLKSAPAILKRLVFARSASNLWGGLAAALPDHDSADAPEPVVNAAIGEATFTPDASYVLLNTASGETGDGLHVSIVFSLDFLMNNLSHLGTDQMPETGKAGQTHQRLETVAFDANVRMDAVIDRLEMSLADCYRLDVGDVLVLAGAQDKQISLEVDGFTEKVRIGTGSMGAWKDRRAIRVVSLAAAQEIQSKLASGPTGIPIVSKEIVS